MRISSLPLTTIIHENLSTIMCFAYSRQPLTDLVSSRFKGEWKYLNKALFEISEQRAERACLELALFLRTLDDDEDISGYLHATRNVPSCGTLFFKDGKIKRIPFRDVTNKIIHAAAIVWAFSPNTDPLLICQGPDPNRWIRAEIDLIPFASVCGQLIS
jgi:hypothetical protein